MSAKKRVRRRRTAQMYDTLGAIRKALEGLTHWMQWKRAYYPFYPLTEGAITAELWPLLRANLPKNFKISPEVPLVDLGVATPPSDGRKPAVDLVVVAPQHARWAIEVKRWQGAWGPVEADFLRLAQVRSAQPPGFRGFVLLTSEGSLPRTLVTPNHHARKAVVTIGVDVRVRIVCKSSRAKRSGYSAALIELG